MPAPSDDDIFKRMFASFVARKTRTPAPPPPGAPAPRMPEDRPAPHMPEDRRAPGVLRKSATDFNGRSFSPHGPPPPDIATPRHPHHSVHVPPTHRPARQNERSGLQAIFPFRSHAQPLEQPRAPSPPRRTHAAPRAGRSSKGSKGSKGSEKQVSASTEDAPPRKRTRTHPVQHPPLQRSQSAHAGSLHSSHRSKSEKQRASGRYQLPPSHVTPPTTAVPQQAPRQQGETASKASAASKSFPCDKCQAVFAQKGQLSRHTRRVHEKLRPHACEYCGRLFGARSDKARHVTVS